MADQSLTNDFKKTELFKYREVAAFPCSLEFPQMFESFRNDGIRTILSRPYNRKILDFIREIERKVMDYALENKLDISTVVDLNEYDVQIELGLFATVCEPDFTIWSNNQEHLRAAVKGLAYIAAQLTIPELNLREIVPAPHAQF